MAAPPGCQCRRCRLTQPAQCSQQCGLALPQPAAQLGQQRSRELGGMSSQDITAQLQEGGGRGGGSGGAGNCGGGRGSMEA